MKKPVLILASNYILLGAGFAQGSAWSDIVVQNLLYSATKMQLSGITSEGVEQFFFQGPVRE